MSLLRDGDGVVGVISQYYEYYVNASLHLACIKNPSSRAYELHSDSGGSRWAL